MLKNYNIYNTSLASLPKDKMLIHTINVHSYNVAQRDTLFNRTLKEAHVLIPDGIGVVWAIKWLTGKVVKKIAGADLFFYEMQRLQDEGGSCFFLGSSEQTLVKIKDRAKQEYPNVNVGTYSPPYKAEFSSDDTQEMIAAVNAFKPDVLFVGMTAPKQEKWGYLNYEQLAVKTHICAIGAVFDFYAGNIKRAPKWMINLGLEWFYRLVKEPKRMWRRYIVGIGVFLFKVFMQLLKK